MLAILSGFAMTNQHTSSMFVMALICFVLSDLFDHGVRIKLHFYSALFLFSDIFHHKNIDIVNCAIMKMGSFSPFASLVD